MTDLRRLESVAEVLDVIAEVTGRVVSWLTLGMVVVTFVIVVLRYAFGVGWIAMQESVGYMHALVFMLGAAYTLKHEGHVRVDVLYRGFGPRMQAWVDLLGTLFLLLPVSAFLIWVSWEYVASSWRLREASPQAGGLPGVFLLKTVIPLMAALLLLQGIAQALRCLLVLRGELGAAPEHAKPEAEL